MAIPPPALKISELHALPDTFDPTTVQFPVAFGGFNYRVALSLITGTVTKASLGLDQVDNTSDANKPVSGAVEQALQGKSDTGHNHLAAEISDLQTVVKSYDWSHTHAIGNIVGLQGALNGKLDSNGTIEFNQVSGLADILVRKAESVHTHSIGDINGLSTGLQAIWNAIGEKLDASQVVPATVVAGDVQW